VGFCLSGASPRARCEVVSANQGRSTGLNGMPTVHRDEPMEEETAHPDNVGVRTANLPDSTEHWDEGVDGEAFFQSRPMWLIFLSPCVYP
jgi:hypothetical protein